ncbi:hypothetical protein WBG99_05525 [Streptomyces sp. TG1A-60]|uniref:hypothetical protein n=1 Tax=Streptomyces sp. TG1A-60 TaxID=3129111 RepID=UPI0030CD38BD
MSAAVLRALIPLAVRQGTDSNGSPNADGDDRPRNDCVHCLVRVGRALHGPI